MHGPDTATRSITIHVNNWNEHCDRIEHILHKLSENHITLKLDKSKLIADEVEFLSFILSKSGITPSPDKVSAVQHFPTP